MTGDTFRHLRFEQLPPYKPSNQEAWHLPEDAKALKLDWNESPLPPAPSVMLAVQQFLNRPNALNWYPDADSVQLRETLAAHWQIPLACVQTYCGSDSALQSAARVFTKAGDSVLMVSPTYDNFRIYSLEAECRVILDGPEDIYTLTGDDVRRLLEKHRPRLVYLANPNNPTGWLVPHEQVSRVATDFPETMILLDEAYGEYAGETAIPLAATTPNIVVGRTFSKAYGLAGLRIGYLIATPGNIEQLNLIRNGKNVSMIGQIAAVAAVKDQEYLRSALLRLRDGQEVLSHGLTRLGIFHRITPANFVLIKVEDASAVQNELARRRIYIRSMSHLKGMTGFLRITLGDKDQMQSLVSALESILRGSRA